MRTSSSFQVCFQELAEENESLVHQMADQKMISKCREDKLVTQAAAQQRKVLEVCPSCISSTLTWSCHCDISVLSFLLCVKLSASLIW